MGTSRRLVLAEQAIADLVGIGVYLSRTAGPDVAATFVAALDAKLSWIARSGTTGASREEPSPGLRIALFKKRRIYFRIEGDTCRIIRILHVRQNLTEKTFS
jgi:plasmid stabilization system protein ParE